MVRINHKQDRTVRRKTGQRPRNTSFLIICEGANTEPEYFRAFRLASASIKVIGKGMGTMPLVKEAISIRQYEEHLGKVYDQYWVVFDKDDYSDDDFNGAIRLASKGGFQVAYSNQAFEYWLLLHFNLYQGTIPRAKYADMLGKLIGQPYSKKSGAVTRIFPELRLRTNIAIRNARIVAGTFPGNNPAKEESSTTVYKLVEQIQKFK